MSNTNKCLSRCHVFVTLCTLQFSISENEVTCVVTSGVDLYKLLFVASVFSKLNFSYVSYTDLKTMTDCTISNARNEGM